MVMWQFMTEPGPFAEAPQQRPPRRGRVEKQQGNPSEPSHQQAALLPLPQDNRSLPILGVGTACPGPKGRRERRPHPDNPKLGEIIHELHHPIKSLPAPCQALGWVLAKWKSVRHWSSCPRERPSPVEETDGEADNCEVLPRVEQQGDARLRC